MNPKFTAEQDAVVHADPEGVVLCEACPGSGKTAVIKKRVPYLLRHREQNGNSQSEVLVLAFNKDVAEGIGTHFRTTMSADDCARVTAKTCHGIATSMVYKFRWATPLKGVDKIEIKSGAFIAKVAEGDFQGVLTSVQARALLDVEGYAAARGITLEVACTRVHKKVLASLGMPTCEVPAWVERLRTWRMGRGWITHDDTIPLAMKMPASCFMKLGNRRQGFTDVIVDEFQDLNWPQRELMKRFISCSQSFTAVGDPDQSIQAWAGADAYVFEDFRKVFRSAKTYPLTQNFRCTDAVLEVANRIRSRDLKRGGVIRGQNRPGAAVEVHVNGAEGLIAYLRQRYESGDDWRDMAVLYRTKRQTPPLERALAASGIPYVLIGSSFFEVPEVADVLAYVHAVYEPVPTFEPWLRLMDHYEGIGAAVAEAAWADTGGRPFQSGYTPRLATYSRARDGWARLQANIETLQAASTQGLLEFVAAVKDVLTPYWLVNAHGVEGLEGILENVDGLLKWVADFGDHVTGTDVLMALQAHGDGNRHRDPDVDAVVVRTAHSGKGLEFKDVAIWNVGNGTFPYRATTEEETLSEHRLMFVAVTRAKNTLALICASEDAAANVAVVGYVPDPQAVLDNLFTLFSSDGLLEDYDVNKQAS